MVKISPGKSGFPLPQTPHMTWGKALFAMCCHSPLLLGAVGIALLERGVLGLKNLAAMALLMKQGTAKCEQLVSEMKALEKSMRGAGKF